MPDLGGLQLLVHPQGANAQAEQDGLEAEVLRIIQATAQNFSSMHQDVQNGRRTEVSFLLGQACRAAHQHGVVTPELRELLDRLQALLRRHELPDD